MVQLVPLISGDDVCLKGCLLCEGITFQKVLMLGHPFRQGFHSLVIIIKLLKTLLALYRQIRQPLQQQQPMKPWAVA